MTTKPALAIVIIGRNEGERLTKCLESCSTVDAAMVYVDSGSSDDSIRRALEKGVTVVELDMRIPFTAGRARNAGFARLMQDFPALKYVQFVDGDCRVVEGWIEYAIAYLAEHPEVAIVCGRRYEAHPDASIFNRLCDIEWDTPIGKADACGGDFLASVEAFKRVGGFNESLIAGEEPEMCFRLTALGFSIHRIERGMTVHDAAMERIGQWWKRSARAGHAYAARAFLHRGTGYCLRENLRIVVWALILPAIIAILAVISPWSLLLAVVYPIQWFRARASVRKSHPDAPAGVYALFLLLGKWPEHVGQVQFAWRALLRKEQHIIEYK